MSFDGSRKLWRRSMGWAVIGRVALALSGAWIAAGCGDASDEPTAENPEVVQLELDPFVIHPGEQGLKCQTFANRGSEPLDVVAWSAHLSSGGHHLLAFIAEQGTDEPLANCSAGSDASDTLGFQSQAAGDSALEMPEGVSARIPAGGALRVQVHYLNPTSEDITVKNRLVMTLAEPGTTTKHVARLQFDNLAIAVPPHSKPTTVTKSCSIPRPLELVWLTSHMHVHGVGFEASLGDQTLLVASSWSDPPTAVFRPLEPVAKGDSITFSCTYVNGSDAPVAFGPSLETDEMCVLAGAYVPAEGDDATTLECSQPGGCLSCIDSLKAGSSEAACSDNGPPSSRDNYEALDACTCGTGCSNECAASACAGVVPDPDCSACIDAHCSTERAACLAG